MLLPFSKNQMSIYLLQQLKIFCSLPKNICLQCKHSTVLSSAVPGVYAKTAIDSMAVFFHFFVGPFSRIFLN